MRAFAYWGHKLLRWLVPHFMAVGLIANVLLIANPAYAGFLALQLVGMLCACVAYRLPVGAALSAPFRAASYFYLMNYALLAGFCRFLFRTQKVTWDKAHQISYAVALDALPERPLARIETESAHELAVAAESAQG